MKSESCLANIYQDRTGKCIVEIYFGGERECEAEAALWLEQGAKVLAMKVPVETPILDDL